MLLLKMGAHAAVTLAVVGAYLLEEKTHLLHPRLALHRLSWTCY